MGRLTAALHVALLLLLGLDGAFHDEKALCVFIKLDGEKGTLDVELTQSELDRRAKEWKPRAAEYTSGYLWKYTQQVGSARNGAVTHPGGAVEKACYADI